MKSRSKKKNTLHLVEDTRAWNIQSFFYYFFLFFFLLTRKYLIQLWNNSDHLIQSVQLQKSC